MLEDIRQIPNPVTRSLRVGLMGSTILTLAVGLVITLIREPRPYRLAVAASLLGAVGGAVAGAVVSKDLQSQHLSSQGAATSAKKEPQGWRRFRVNRKVKESAEITSFYLQPEDSDPLPAFQPGQFLTIQLSIPNQDRPVIRTYSLSDVSATQDYYRLSIKRESAPRDLEVPPGVASTFMHDHVQEGDSILVKPPSGRFVLDPEKPIPAVLLSNGVGITPMICMAKACTVQGSSRPLWFVHGARDGKLHAFREEMNQLQSQNPHLQIYYRYSRPTPDDEGHYHSVGYVDMDFLQQILWPSLEPIAKRTEVEYFLCGSPPFLAAMRAGLKGAGIADEQVYFESFGERTLATTPAPAPTDLPTTAEVVCTRSGQTFTWTVNEGSLLDSAEAHGLSPASSCRSGICLTCMCSLQEGEIHYPQPPTGSPDQGSVLICVGRPQTPRVVLDL
jgi:hypothetical protein